MMVNETVNAVFVGQLSLELTSMSIIQIIISQEIGGSWNGIAEVVSFRGIPQGDPVREIVSPISIIEGILVILRKINGHDAGESVVIGLF